jgi:transposase InsO family protein
MPDNHSTTPSPSGKPTKPSKPYPAFPLTPHPSGRWCKKSRGKLHYFGQWDDPDAALKKYLEQKDALHAGRMPRPDADVVTVKKTVNAFLRAKLPRQRQPASPRRRAAPTAGRHYQGLLERHGITCGMSRRGDCWDNAPMGSFFCLVEEGTDPP